MKKKVVFFIVAIILNVLVFVFSNGLFKKFIINPDSSDYANHISAAINNEGYSLMHLIFKCAHHIYDNPIFYAFIMSMITVATVVVLFVFLKKLFKSDKFAVSDYIILAISISSLFVASIYIPKYYNYLYVSSTLITQPWHNSTYVLMRLFGFATLILYYYLIDNYYKKGNKHFFIIFTVLLTLVNYSKPNFFLAFAPSMLILLIYDLIKSRGKKLKSIIDFGMCVVISMPVLFYQTSKVYDSGEKSSIIISAEKFINAIRNERYLLSLFSNLLFPILVLLVILFISRKSKLNVKKYIQSWLMFLFSYLQYMFMAETGPRAQHGNYSWGIYFFTLNLYLISLYELIKLKKEQMINSILFYFIIFIYILNVVFGIYYFYLLLIGDSYIM